MHLIQNRLEKLMRLDSHVDKGSYLISSLYYDDYKDSCFYDVEAGVNLRKKYRLRIYNHNARKVSLESKFKNNNMMLKHITLLSGEQARLLNEGKYLRCIDDNDELKKQFTYDMMSCGLRPMVIVEYERIPYVYETGNVRITFDMNIRSSRDIGNFMKNYGMCRPVLPDDLLIMEVKYDELLPSVIYDCIDIGNLQQISISKYTLCRRYVTGAEDMI